MFASPYADQDEERTQVGCTPPRVADGAARILVPDSDNDDSLGLPLSQEQPSNVYVPAARAFSKRAARCAAALLEHHDAATASSPSSPAHKQKCIQQLGRLGGAYRSLAHGKAVTIWVRYQDLNARVIRETEAFFEEHMADYLAHPHVTRKNGAPSAALKTIFSCSVQGNPPEALVGCRAPLLSSASPTYPTHATPHSGDALGEDTTHPPAGYAISRGEQCALSLLLMEDTPEEKQASSPLPTFSGLHTSKRGSPRVGLSESLRDSTSHSSFLSDTHATVPFWVYEDDSDDSVRSPPSPAAHRGGGASAAKRFRKRGRSDTTGAWPQYSKGQRGETCTARALVFDDELSSLSSPQNAATREEKVLAHRDLSALASMSATLIELQNQRAQWDMLRQQSLFTPF
ncbi:hypothetical protein JKF63_07190 [Porcisia hertigi]|uniref:Uncharacterized protein n=1 Tax=Porcisia hertigi TaxID=2761500 RepID=A0A837AXZ4_9TRYP|nr:hypothetical protein JKF63_07190 [Porcisia hertigi]